MPLLNAHVHLFIITVKPLALCPVYDYSGKSVFFLFQLSSCLPLDILKFDAKKRQVIIRVPSDNYAKVRAALTVCSSMKIADVDVPVVYSVQQASSCLLSLAGPERVII